MAYSYTRQSTISDGDTITAALFNNEYNQVLNAFAYSSSDAAATGHRHDGSAAQGGSIYKIGDLDFLNKIEADSTNNRWGFYVEVSSSAVEQIRVQDGAIVPVTDNDIDLGTSSLEFKNAYFDGTVTTDALVADTADINGGTVDGATIGAASASTIVGTTITANTAFVPDASDGAALGTTSLEFSDLYLADGAVVYFGDDQDVSLTHVADTGLLLSSTDQLQFGDSGTYIHQSADGVLDLVSDTELELNATTVDINGNVDISGTVQVSGATTFGVDDTGVDVKFFGATASAYLLWDESADKLLTAGGAVVDIVKDKLLIGGTAVTTTAAELNVLDAVTAGTVTASLGVVVDSNKDIGTFRNITLSGELDAGSLDVSGDADIDGTLEADAITVDGTALNEYIADTVGAMVGSNTETGIAVTYEDGDNTLDFVLGAAQTTITSLLATDIKIGEDDQTKIDFETADEIHFYAANVEQVYLGDNIFGPQSDSDVDLGTTGVRWKDAYVDSITVTGEIDGNSLDIEGDADINGTLEADAITVDGTALATYIRDTVGTNMLSSNTESGITVTYDTSNDNIDFAIDAAQTGITSIYATDLILGEDSQTAIDFGTPNEIDFKADNAARLTLTSSALYPVTNNEIDLGTSSLEFKNAYFDGTVTAAAFAGPLTGNVTGNASGTAATVTGAAQSNITSLGTLTTLTVDNVIVNGTTIGHTDDTDLMTVADGVLTVAGEVSMTTLDIGGTNVTSTAAELNKLDGVGTLKQAGLETIYVPAAAMYPTSTNGCADLEQVETTAQQPEFKVLDFDKNSTEYAQFAVAFPKSWNAGVVTFQAYWLGIAATTGVAWALQGKSVADGVESVAAFGTAIVVQDDSQGDATETLITAESGDVTIAGAADDSLTYFQIYRDHDDGNDDMDGDARLLGIKLFFTTDAANDAQE